MFPVSDDTIFQIELLIGLIVEYVCPKYVTVDVNPPLCLKSSTSTLIIVFSVIPLIVAVKGLKAPCEYAICVNDCPLS